MGGGGGLRLPVSARCERGRVEKERRESSATCVFPLPCALGAAASLARANQQMRCSGGSRAAGALTFN